NGAISALKTEAAYALHRLFSFLNPDQLQRLAALMPEGRSVPLASIAEIHTKLADALRATAVTPTHKPFFDALCAHSSPEALLAGFKFIRGDEESAEPGDAGEEGGEGAAADDGRPKLFYWFFVPIRDRKIMAWEATSGSGRATYF